MHNELDLEPIKKSIAKDVKDLGKPPPSDEELTECAKALIAFVEISGGSKQENQRFSNTD